MNRITESLEDYLIIIFQLLSTTGEARVKNVAQRKGVKMSSVTAALKRLERVGAIKYYDTDGVKITPDGLALVRGLVTRRDQVRTFLRQVLGVSRENAASDAGGIEHHVSSETLDRLAVFTDFVTQSTADEKTLATQFQYYYDSCLNSDSQSATCEELLGSENEEKAVTLLDIPPGERARIKRIIARSLLRQRLVDMGFLPNVEVLVERIAPLGDPLEVKIKNFHLSIRKEEAARILVTPLRESVASERKG